MVDNCLQDNFSISNVLQSNFCSDQKISKQYEFNEVLSIINLEFTI